ncbi:hypothetical protein [Streptomyces sp. NPDC093990]|uniref:hypothetical protein n=1 Tax=Streptomyces sp. NPDC093990 TaxID=3155306 RepID=UPI0034149F99
MAGTALLMHVKSRSQGTGELHRDLGSRTGWHCAMVAARIPDLAGKPVQAAVVTDRQTWVSRIESGAGLGISTETARARSLRDRRMEQSGRSESEQ